MADLATGTAETLSSMNFSSDPSKAIELEAQVGGVQTLVPAPDSSLVRSVGSLTWTPDLAPQIAAMGEQASDIAQRGGSFDITFLNSEIEYGSFRPSMLLWALPVSPLGSHITAYTNTHTHTHTHMPAPAHIHAQSACVQSTVSVSR